MATEKDAQEGHRTMSDIIVLIPHYNNLDALHRSLASITAAEPVEVLIVDDGSAVKPDAEDLGLRYPLIHGISCLQLEQNQGIEHALNKGLAHIRSLHRYKYIARLDCGNTCHPDRFKVKRDFLDAHPAVYLAGTWTEFRDMEGKELFTVRYPTDAKTLRKKIYLNNMFNHPSVMFRAAAVEKIGYYPTDFKYAEDYAFFFRFVRHFETANIPQVLTSYEVNPTGISLSKRRKQIESRIRIILRNWHWGVYPVWGIIRSSILYVMSYALITRLKEALYR